jgi:heme oxygenase
MQIDTPISRATINQLSVDELDKQLDAIRARRLVRVQKLEELAKVKADEARLTNYIKFEGQLQRVKRMLEKHMETEQKLDEAIHKLRVIVLNMELM